MLDRRIFYFDVKVDCSIQSLRDYEITHFMMILLGRGVFFLSVITILCCPPSATLSSGMRINL